MAPLHVWLLLLYPIYHCLPAASQGNGNPEVTLKVYNSKGETAEWLTPGENTTYECLYSGGYYSAFKDGQDRYILRYSAQDDTTTPNTDFEHLVSDYSGSPGNLTMKLLYPHCSKDGVVKCDVMDSNADSKINMSKLDFADPAQNVEIYEVKPCTYICSVEDILPKGRFVWHGGCVEDTSTMIPDGKCMFSQTSTARCNSSHHGQQIACEFIHDNSMTAISANTAVNCPGSTTMPLPTATSEGSPTEEAGLGAGAITAIVVVPFLAFCGVIGLTCYCARAREKEAARKPEEARKQEEARQEKARRQKQAEQEQARHEQAEKEEARRHKQAKQEQARQEQATRQKEATRHKEEVEKEATRHKEEVEKEATRHKKEVQKEAQKHKEAEQEEATGHREASQVEPSKDEAKQEEAKRHKEAVLEEAQRHSKAQQEEAERQKKAQRDEASKRDEANGLETDRQDKAKRQEQEKQEQASSQEQERRQLQASQEEAKQEEARRSQAGWWRRVRRT